MLGHARFPFFVVAATTITATSSSPSSPTLPPATTGGHRAFFILFAPMLESPDWPSRYEEYRGGVVVMNPFNASRATIQKVQRDLDVKVVMYFDSMDIQIKAQGKCLGAQDHGNPNICSDDEDPKMPWKRCASGAMPCCYGYECNAYNTTTCPVDDYARALWGVYKPEWAVNELHKTRPGTPICRYGKGPLAVHSAQSNAALVPFLAAWLKDHGYDGVYFDECESCLPPALHVTVAQLRRAATASCLPSELPALTSELSTVLASLTCPAN